MAESEIITGTLATSGRLDKALAELSVLEKKIADEKIPLARELNTLESEVIAKRREHVDAKRLQDRKSVDLGKLKAEEKGFTDQNDYLRKTLLEEYIRRFETRIHASEKEQYQSIVRVARETNDNPSSPAESVFTKQLTVVQAALDRLDNLLGGHVYDGSALNAEGIAGRQATFETEVPALDALRETSGNARRAIAAMEARYRSETGISALKIKHNGVLGYFIEVPARHGDALMGPDSGFTHRQTMANAVRFNSVHLHEEASRIAEAGGHALAAEEAHFEALVETVVAARERIAQTADALARIDVAAALAERAAEGDWCAPQIDDAPCLEIVAGRHPVVEAALAKAGERFVPNDCGLAETDRLWLIGGPNMGGKSTFLRANALIVLLAQAGSYVPATSARIGLVDRLFSRVGASDNLARGRSTFMVEMVETAAILARASERSFVILDEIGRGTSTYDGLALAWAVAEAIHENNRCRCLFATHYHELARLAESCDALSLHHVRAREWQGDLVFLHEVIPGAADRSYGIHVGRLAGLPGPVLVRAEEVLRTLEQGEEGGAITRLADDLPLFQAAPATPPAAAGRSAMEAALGDINPDALTPQEALELLYRLKALSED